MSLNKCFPCLKFQNEEVITKLDYSNTVLLDIFPNVWEYERTLEELCLTSTRIRNLPPQLFYCQSVRILMVNNNSLESVPNAIGSLRQLQVLNLSRNLISNVPDNIKFCKSLTHLDLSCNNLQRLPDAITSLISLQELLLNETYLEFLPANFGRLINLKILELRLNNLIALPKSMVRLCNLQRIDIGSNEFNELPEVIGELKQLRELWIDFNQISNIAPNIAKLRELEHFEANGNSFNTMPSEISNWNKIEVLSVCTNNLQYLPFEIGMLKSLVTFKCVSNELRDLPNSISNLENLEELVLSHNQLERLPATIGMLRKLRFLFVDDNELNELPEEICSCNNLSVLSVSRNQITELPQNIGHLTKLKVLNLVSNSIGNLPVSMLSLVNLTSLWLSDNQSQPLVPLQYLDPNTKTRLTCFMLPQVNLKQYESDYLNSIVGHRHNNENIEVSLEQSEIGKTSKASVNPFASPIKRIWFAADATVLTENYCQDEFDYSTNKSKTNEGSKSKCATNPENHYGIRLMRSPTPYPKELRLLAKYLRNGQKVTHTNLSKAKEPHVSAIVNTNSCDTNILRDNNSQLLPSGSDNMYYEYATAPSQILEQSPLFTSSTLKSDHSSNQAQYLYQVTQESTTPLFYAAGYYLASADLNLFNESKIKDTNNYNIGGQNQEEQLLPNYYVSNNALQQPPPYHIARAHTKKTQADLTNYETMRNLQHQHQPTQEVDEGNEDVVSKLNSNYSNKLYNPNPCAINNNSFDSDLQIECVNSLINSNEEADWDTHINNDSNNISSSGNATIKRTNPWLFGVHKNPTVKQVTIKWETHAGFEIEELPNKKGLFVSSIVPNTNAARLLCVNDKLLEIDGHDFTNITLNDAKTIIHKPSSVINVMLSRI